MGRHSACGGKPFGQPQYDLADIFRVHGPDYRARNILTPDQRKAMWAIEACRTAILGGHLDECLGCGHQRPAYNSCCNRHCPKCQALAQHRWVEKRRERILPVSYFHVVFTLPGELAPLGLMNRPEIYRLLFRTASETLSTLGWDPKWLGAQLGITAVLHTWKRNQQFHPHVHCIVMGGGLSRDGDRWIDTDSKYLFPVRVLSRLYRGKFLDGLSREHDAGKLELPEALAQGDAFSRLRGKLFEKEWVVYAKRPFAGAEQVFSYLGRYTHRVGLSNYRLLEVTDDSVTIATRGEATATMSPHELIRRFLLHILPKGFMKIRHYGLMASSNVNTRLETAKELLGQQGRIARSPEKSAPADESTEVSETNWQFEVERLTGVDLAACPACGSRHLRRIAIQPRPPPSIRNDS